MAYSIAGEYVGSCTCANICGCAMDVQPIDTQGKEECYGAFAFSVDRGNLDDVDLAGVTFAMLLYVTNNLTAMDILDPGKKLSFPRSVVEMMQGHLGYPPGGFPKVLQKIILNSAGVKPIKGRPGAKLPKVNFAAMKQELSRKLDREPTNDEALSYVLYPQVFSDFDKHRQLYGDTSVVPTNIPSIAV